VVMGHDVHSGGAFAVDPWEWYATGIITNPNLTMCGDVGAGKSATLKVYCLRQLVFGRQCWFLDPKGEYDRLCRAVGVEPVYLRPGGDVRLNPLDPRVGGDQVPPEQVRDAQLQILQAVAAAALRRSLTSEEQGACAESLLALAGRTDEPTLPMVVDEMLEPSEAAAQALHTSRRGLAQRTREAALALRRLVQGDLAGMFDAPTSDHIDMTAPVVSLNLRAVYESDALGVLMVCAAAWLKRAVDRDDGTKRILVVDEGWAVLNRLEVSRWLRARWKLVRADGAQNIAVVHRLSDLEAAGGRDSEQVRLARGLLSDSETKVIFRQASDELPLVREMCQLSERETAIVGSLPKGSALWKVGRRSFQVEHLLSRWEQEITYTDERMRVG
jgi:type IV secretory pathway VirB4 component